MPVLIRFCQWQGLLRSRARFRALLQGCSEQVSWMGALRIGEQKKAAFAVEWCH